MMSKIFHPALEQAAADATTAPQRSLFKKCVAVAVRCPSITAAHSHVISAAY